MRAWKVGDFACISEDASATLYRISEITEYSAHLIYYNLLNGRSYNDGWVNLIQLRKPKTKQYEATILEHLQELDSDVFRDTNSQET